MNYSFYGTCADDSLHFLDCLETMVRQTIKPKQIILVYAGDKNIEIQIKKKLTNFGINLVYISKKLSRVDSLNLALENSLAKYSFRFDARTRFSYKYAEEALKFLEDKTINASVVGGVPLILEEKNSIEGRLCARILSSYYIFFYPNHRNKYFNGYSSSVYLGCFKTNLLKKIKYRNKENLISEDSLIISDFSDKGHKTYINENIEVSYVCRSSFYKLLKLFNTYGYCRANTIFISKKLFLSFRHFIIFISLLVGFILLSRISIIFIFFIPFSLLVLNIFGELLCFKSKNSFFIAICATLCQFSWILGFFWKLMTIFNKKNKKSNFIS